MAKGRRIESVTDVGGGPYEVLGVPHDASPEDIRKAFLAIAKRFHPDVVVVGSTKDEKLLDGIIREANTAYSILRDTKQRAAYDKAQSFLKPKCRTCKGTGRASIRRGFTVSTVTCPDCSGAGK